MVESTQKVDQIVRDYITDVSQYFKVNKVILFGSYAKGTNDKYSDLDIAIFSDSFKNKKNIEIMMFLMKIARKYKDICIEPVAFDAEDLVDDNPFIKEILSTGREIYLH